MQSKIIRRKVEYSRLKSALGQLGISFESIVQSLYKDKIRLFSNADELNMEMDYSGEGMVNLITAKYYSNISIWDDLIKAIEEIKR